jgi:predicted PhzF superfamily epimerase YddE/YHI9
VVQECGAGVVTVRTHGDRLAFSAPPRQRSGPVAPELLTALIEILGVESERVVDAEWLDNGPGWVGLLLDHATTVLSLCRVPTTHPGRWGIRVIGAHDPGSEAAFKLRAFFTEGDEPLREDPVTGSLNAAATAWLLATGRGIACPVLGAGSQMAVGVQRGGRSGMALGTLDSEDIASGGDPF